MTPTLSEEQFVEYIEFLKERRDAEERINQMLTEEFEDSIFFPYTRFETILIQLLSQVMNDRDDWIGYFCWERDFGRDCKLGDVQDADGSPIPLSTPQDLYKLLISLQDGN